MKEFLSTVCGHIPSERVCAAYETLLEISRERPWFQFCGVLTPAAAITFEMGRALGVHEERQRKKAGQGNSRTTSDTDGCSALPEATSMTGGNI